MHIKHFFRYWLPLVVWCAIIFVQSSFASLDVVPHWPYIDKVLHVGVYAFLGLLFSRAFNTLSGLHGRRGQLLILSTALTTFYGLTDEWHQSFVAERCAEFADLVADSIGGVSGGLFFGWYARAETSRN